MTALNYSKPIAILLISLATSANADLSGLGGSVGSAVGGAVGAVGGVTSSVSNTSVSTSTSANASVPGVAAVDLCVGASINSGGSGGCGAAEKALSPTRNVPVPNNAISSKLLVGMPVFGAGDEMVGRVKRVALADQTIIWILVETTKNRRVQLTNAVKSVDTNGVKLGLTRGQIESRLKGSFTRLRVQCNESQQRRQDPNKLNSCWKGA